MKIGNLEVRRERSTRLNKKLSKKYIKILSSFMSLIILVLLLLSAPAEAFVLSLIASNNAVFQGDKIYFDASLNIDSNEYLDIDYLSLNIGNNISCKFFVNGSVLSGCNGISVQQISSVSYGYGYGYGYNNGSLRYNITLNTAYFLPGTYNTSLNVKIDDRTFSKDGEIIRIYSKGGGGAIVLNNNCYLQKGSSIFIKSLTGKGGDLIVNGYTMDSSKNKLTISVPKIGSKSGKGSLISQQGKNRVSYPFTIQEIEDNYDYSSIEVKGYYTYGKYPKKLITSIIYIDKNTGKVSITGNNVSLTNMDIHYNGPGC